MQCRYISLSGLKLSLAQLGPQPQGYVPSPTLPKVLLQPQRPQSRQSGVFLAARPSTPKLSGFLRTWVRYFAIAFIRSRSIVASGYPSREAISAGLWSRSGSFQSQCVGSFRLKWSHLEKVQSRSPTPTLQRQHGNRRVRSSLLTERSQARQEPRVSL